MTVLYGKRAEWRVCNFKAKHWLILGLLIYFIGIPALAPSVANQLPIISNPNYPVNPSVISSQYQTQTSSSAQLMQVQPLPASPSQGTLALGVTDPPSGGHYATTTSLKVTISGVSIHSDSNNSWVNIPLQQTTVDLVAATNLEALIATLNIPIGHYNIIRFNVTSAVATVQASSVNPNNPQLAFIGCPAQANPNCANSAATTAVSVTQTVQCPSQSQNPNCTTLSTTATTITATGSPSLTTINLKIPSGKIQLTITNAGITISNGSIAHLVVDVRINEPSISQAGVFAASSWTANPS